MQTLGLSDSPPRTESRIQSLFWPSIQTGSDVDYLGAQGYWVCTAAGVLAFVFSVISGHAIVATVVLLFYYLGGVSVLSEQRKLYEQRKMSPYFVAQTDARLGNKREALKYLTICVQSHDQVVLNLIDDQGFISLHGNPAFKQLLAKIGHPSVN